MLSAECDRARARASLALDCELSELERVQLRAHLAGCRACASFVGGVRELTQELRTAPLPAPSRPLVLRRPRYGRIPVLAAIVAIVVAAAAGGLAGSLADAHRPPQVTATGPRLAALFFVRPHLVPGARLPLRAAV